MFLIRPRMSLFMILVDFSTLLSVLFESLRSIYYFVYYLQLSLHANQGHLRGAQSVMF